ncbi:hypothetical protein MVEN_01469000 [Mycena venus]|uniref:C2H2-type domain-containing protein n=1 Tax=Mycena venus TaxID=2733690 RepID=A0A8H6XV55_9AGAR|nr:hypothetical protein MVEN_01469000 [Mycena venus]
MSAPTTHSSTQLVSHHHHNNMSTAASPVSPTYTDFSASSSDFTADSIRSPLDDAFDFRQGYHPAQQATHHQGQQHGDEFFAYHHLPWSSPVEPKKAQLFSSQGYYAPVSVYVPQQQIHAPLPSHHGPPGQLPSLELELADEWRAQQQQQQQQASYAVRSAPTPASKTDQMYASHGGNHQSHVHNQLYNGAGGGGVQRSYSANAVYGYQQAQQYEPTPSPTSPTSTWDIHSHAPSLSPALSHSTSHSHPSHSPSMHHTAHPLSHAHSHSGALNSHAHAHSQHGGVDPRYVLSSPQHARQSPGHSPALSAHSLSHSGRSNSVRSSPAHSPLANVLALADGEDNTAQYTADFSHYPATTTNGNRSSPNGSASPSAEQDADLDADADADADADPRRRRGRRERFGVRRQRQRERLRWGVSPPLVSAGARASGGAGGRRYAPYAYSPSPSTSVSTGTSGSYGGYEGYADYESGMVPSHNYLDNDADPAAYLHGGVVGGGARRPRARPSAALPVPIPVPNLTKKSRGRRVPTVQSLYGGQGDFGRRPSNAKSAAARLYTCKVPGCGKCFARGEHLKRHVRSIHTYEKRECLRLRLLTPPPFLPAAAVFYHHDSGFANARTHSPQMPVPRLREGLFAARQPGAAHACA